MRIGLVAIHAFRESQRLFKIGIGVALGAVDAGVLALQRMPSDRLQQHDEPGTCSAAAVFPDDLPDLSQYNCMDGRNI